MTPETSAKAANAACRLASRSPRLLPRATQAFTVSIDYKDDPRSSIVDAPSTMVVDGTQVKVLAWYDNEWGYVNRMMELARMMARSP